MENKHGISVSTEIARYSSSSIYRRFLGLVYAFVKPKFLSPELYGLWNILNLIPFYASHMDLGSYSSMRYLIPYNEAKDELKRNREIKNSVFYGSLYLNLFVSIALIIFSLKGGLTLPVRLGVLTMAFVVTLGWYYGYYITFLKSYQNFRLISSSNYLRATVVVSLGIVLLYFFNIYGLYMSMILSLVVVILYLRSRESLDLEREFKFSVFKGLIKRGFPIMIFSFAAVVISTSDRLVISSLLGNKQLGYYGIAIMAFGFLMQIPGVAREVVEPRLMQSIDKDSKEKNLKEYLFKPLLNTAYYMPFLIGAVFWIFPILIPLILPRYVQGILPTQIISLGSYFFALSYVTRGIIVANNWELKSLVIMIFALLLNIGLNIVLIKLGLGLPGVAAGSSISFFVLLVGLLSFLRKKCSYAQKEWNLYLLAIFWPFLTMSIMMLISKYFVGIFNLVNKYVVFLLYLFVFYIIMIGLTKLAHKKYTLLKPIKMKGLKKFIFQGKME